MSEIRRRRTKIVCTMGPSTDEGDNLEKIIAAGANVVRMNFSHGSPEEHIERAERVRSIAKKLGREVAILGDLQGPKIRVSTFKDDKKIFLNVGDKFILDATLGRGEGTQEAVGIDYKELPKDVKPGDILLLNDGYVQLVVDATDGIRVQTTVIVAGPLSNNKGINKKGGGLTAPALTAKDREDIKLAARIGVEYLAVSFPRTGADLDLARGLAEEAGLYAKIVAKVERAEAVASVEAMDDVIKASDVIMVARGDLAVEIGDAELPAIQKLLIERCRAHGKVIITATQMMESMIKNPFPTRAEVMDVANAIIDGTDAVMTSAETAAGDYPAETVKTMVDVALGAEKLPSVSTTHVIESEFTSIEESIAISAAHLGNHLPGVKGIITMTSSGRTALLTSRVNSSLPIYALSKNQTVLRTCALYRGVYPYFFDGNTRSNEGIRAAINMLRDKGLFKKGDKVIVTSGDAETLGSTNCARVLIVD
ncbi:pyruvate kinase [Psittacicella gerlachiana]|uniref:Pyruvate kinase n=1 Tax=Psittacicella gerlachiana TaxID=2028574 RepID=A0A3A1Y9N6_9GAMM|nr:pyruvate kinase [Psittacicella gerlachiana]RIY35023.1 pyruvate kinase [Psittacicella gerlachiana]